jgi:hypothetical protein
LSPSYRERFDPPREDESPDFDPEAFDPLDP